MTSPRLSTADRELVDTLLGPWEEAVARGETPRPETICPDRPDLWEALVARAAQLEAMAFLDGQEQAGVHAGQRLHGRFRLIAPLAAGGHAEVWRAQDETFGQDVAVKLMSVGPLARPQRLIEEGRMLASLDHPHIVRVLDAGSEGDIAFLVQALVTGETLAERIEAGPLAEDQVLKWISEIAAALQEAHDQPSSIIHRDVKPANILIGGKGNALLADFGIALPASAAAGGTSTGTLPYKSPEQLDDRPLDRRSDVFSLALVLYELLTGTLPYSAHDKDTIRREMREPLAGRIARLPASRPLPARFLRPLERALAVHPADRPRDARAFCDELACAAEGSRRPVGRGRQIAIAATVVAIAATLAVIAVEAINAERTRREELARRELEGKQAAEQELEREERAREQRAADAKTREQIGNAQREADRALGLFREMQGTVSRVRRMDRDIIEQTRQRDPFRRDPDPPAGAVIPPPPPRPDDGSTGGQP